MAEDGDVKSVGWNVCIANGIAKLRCRPIVNEGKGRQGTEQVAQRE